jgi:hypothetical protein
MKIISSILIALTAVIGTVVMLYGLFLGAVGIFDAWLNKKGRKK